PANPTHPPPATVERLLSPFERASPSDRDVQSAKKIEHGRDDVFGDWNRMHARRVREQHVAVEHLRIERVPDARRRRMHPLELLCREIERAWYAKAEVHVGLGNHAHHLVGGCARTVAIGARLRAYEINVPV